MRFYAKIHITITQHIQFVKYVRVARGNNLQQFVIIVLVDQKKKEEKPTLKRRCQWCAPVKCYAMRNGRKFQRRDAYQHGFTIKIGNCWACIA